MAVILPPTPQGVPPGHSFWNDWYEKLRTIVNSGSVSVLWSNINFAGSSLADIATKEHNTLSSVQGGSAGEKYHMTSVEYSRATTLQTKASDPTTSDLAASKWAIYKNTTSGVTKLWVNDGGTMKSVTLT